MGKCGMEMGQTRTNMGQTWDKDGEWGLGSRGWGVNLGNIFIRSRAGHVNWPGVTG